MSIEEPEPKYWELSGDIGFTPQSIPEGSTEISYDVYITLKAALEAEAVASAEEVPESS